MLVVIPQGSQLNVEKELHGLDMAVSRLGDAIELSVLQGEVTPDRLNDRVNAERWDVVHFIGHGDVVDDAVRVRLNSEDPENPDQWVDGEVFATFFRRSVPRLIVLNCCYGGSQASLRTFSGLGPFLVRAGVPAVVAMQYEIPDTVAIKFAEKFYGELLSGSDPGRIDFALTAARLSLYQNQTKDRPQSFITPVLYLMPGHETLLELADRRSPAIVRRTGDEPSCRGRATPSCRRICSTRSRSGASCRSIGPDLLAVGAMRSKNPPGPRKLAEQLAREAQFPAHGSLRAVGRRLPNRPASGCCRLSASTTSGRRSAGSCSPPCSAPTRTSRRRRPSARLRRGTFPASSARTSTA